MSSRVPVLSLVLAVALLALAASGASAAKTPSVKSFSPKKVEVGQTLTIRGQNFIPGRRRNTVVFKRDRGPAIFVKAAKASRTKLKVVVPQRMVAHMASRKGQARPTRFRIRVLARRFGRRWTSLRSSPIVLASAGAVVGDDCDADRIPNAEDPDDDNDGLLDAREVGLRTDPCKADTDGDALEDGWEVESALDLNVRARPYPGKRPYPNALDPSDPGVDYDGDGLTAGQEHAIWMRFGGRQLPPNPSDGTQYSGGSVAAPTDPALVHLDIDSNGVLSDDERDADADRLSNWDEANGRTTGDWWLARYEEEKPFPVTFVNPDFLDPDTDGDSVRDGDDDQDHDGWTNVEELTRGPYFVHVHNPCLPNPESRTCPRHPPMKDSYPPFPLTTSERPLPWPIG